jgi:hypothetical protein
MNGLRLATKLNDVCGQYSDQALDAYNHFKAPTCTTTMSFALPSEPPPLPPRDEDEDYFTDDDDDDNNGDELTPWNATKPKLPSQGHP